MRCLLVCIFRHKTVTQTDARRATAVRTASGSAGPGRGLNSGSPVRLLRMHGYLTSVYSSDDEMSSSVLMIRRAGPAAGLHTTRARRLANKKVCEPGAPKTKAQRLRARTRTRVTSRACAVPCRHLIKTQQASRNTMSPTRSQSHTFHSGIIAEVPPSATIAQHAPAPPTRPRGTTPAHPGAGRGARSPGAPWIQWAEAYR